jgi:hypothetical protein
MRNDVLSWPKADGNDIFCIGPARIVSSAAVRIPCNSSLSIAAAAPRVSSPLPRTRSSALFFSPPRAREAGSRASFFPRAPLTPALAAPLNYIGARSFLLLAILLLVDDWLQSPSSSTPQIRSGMPHDPAASGSIPIGSQPPLI